MSQLLIPNPRCVFRDRLPKVPDAGDTVSGRVEAERSVGPGIEFFRLDYRWRCHAAAGADIGDVARGSDRQRESRNEGSDAADFPTAQESVQNRIADIEGTSVSERQIEDVAPGKVVGHVCIAQTPFQPAIVHVLTRTGRIHAFRMGVGSDVGETVVSAAARVSHRPAL